MKKKFTGIIICLLMFCMSVFAGCSLVQTNPDKFYNSTVVEIKDKDGNVVSTVSSRELINGYSSMGYYYEYQGMSRAEAVAETITLLENRKIIVYEAEKDATLKNLDEREKTYIWEQVVVALEENISYYLGEQESTNTMGEESPDSATFTAYSKRADYAVEKVKVIKDGREVEEDHFVILKKDVQPGILDGYSPSKYHDYTKAEEKELLYNILLENNKAGKRFEALEKYYDYLVSVERGLNLSTDKKSVFEREIETLCQQSYENYLMTKYSEKLLGKNEISAITAQDILDLYCQKVRTDYTKYVIEGDSSYDSTVSSSYRGTYYYDGSKATNDYFTVANILFNKSTTEAGKYDLIIRQDEDGDGVYELDTKEAKTKSEIEAFIQNNIVHPLTTAQMSSDQNLASEVIKESVFKYNQDPGMLKAEGNYVIGVDKDGKAVSNFVESFNEAGLNLYNQNVFGNVEITDSEYGIHVLVYTGKCENLFSGIDEQFTLIDTGYTEGQVSAFEILANTRVNTMLDKTYFDVLYEELYKDKSSEIEQADLDVRKATYSITHYNSNIPSTLK